MEVGAAQSIDAYEGLVFRTAQMFSELVGLEQDDMRQELRIRVVKALRTYDSSSSSMTERAWVYALVANLVKDLKRYAARRANARLRLSYIEDMRDPLTDELHWFEFTFARSTHDEVYGEIEDGGFTFPSTVTPREQEVVMLLVVGYDRTEIARSLEIEVWAVAKAISEVREKLRDWKPSAAVQAPRPQPQPRPQRAAVAA